MPERMRYGSLVELQESEGNITAVTQVITESEGFTCRPATRIRRDQPASQLSTAGIV